MPVVPEKQQLDGRVQGALASQFWGQPVASARVIAGTTVAAPCEPPPLSLVAPSGLSRTQLLIASHAAGLPLFPGWCEEHGGVVLDRVLVQSGRPRWWAALTGRLKAQRMAGQRSTMKLRETLSDPDNYALAATGRLLLSHATTLRAYVQADDLGQIPASFRGWGPPPTLRRKAGRRARRRNADGDADSEAAPDAEPDAASRGRAHRGGGRAGSGSGSSSAPHGMSAALQLRQALLDGYELTADLAVNEPMLDGVRPATNTPLRLSIDVAPRPTQRLGPLLYRVGAHGVLAPSTAEGAGGGAGGRTPHVLAAHMQGALALAGHATLWQASSKPWQRRSKRETAGALQAPRAAVGPGARLGHTALTAAAPGGEAGDGWQAAQRRASVASDGDDDGSAAGSARRHAGKPRRERAAGSGAPRESGPPLVTPGQVQDGLQQTTWRLERLRTDLQSWASRARAGELLRSGKGKRRGDGGRPGGCWSSFLPPPHLRVSGLVGVLGRLPLHHTHFDARAGGPAASRTSLGRGGSGGLGAASPEPGAHLGGLGDDDGGIGGGAGGAGARGAGHGATALLRQLGGASRGFMEHVVLGGLNGLGGLGSHLAHDVGVRLFAGGGASLQFGQMRRALLDFTRLEATADLGLTGPRVAGGGGGRILGGGGGGSAGRHPVFALDDCGAWHALTLSATQQLVGPVRLRADWRFGLDSDVPLALPRRGGGGSSISGPLLTLPNAATQLARHVGGMRPSVLDAAYGVDVIVPGSGGLVRGVAWYSPRRGEGGIELRLL
ncbi:hypothetical protein Rsub_12414 [Raphidocelis subcapitata]|uniref:Uncharacterized protein n=1 Tax=Raphidocelis subcapitata TaxID=307507 RepID=A0A2V0PKY6_9CHLO|nr:hypothetical protein Rsub_12414 [Raphidocelis subcapitata]|eukprot:GBF99702.1 hypothetical protein Rsub_12414 [Raphidocelis subcapitata]